MKGWFGRRKYFFSSRCNCNYVNLEFQLCLELQLFWLHGIHVRNIYIFILYRFDSIQLSWNIFCTCLTLHGYSLHANNYKLQLRNGVFQHVSHVKSKIYIKSIHPYNFKLKYPLKVSKFAKKKSKTTRANAEELELEKRRDGF